LLYKGAGGLHSYPGEGILLKSGGGRRRKMHLSEKAVTMSDKATLGRYVTNEKLRKKKKKEIEKQVARERQRAVVEMIFSEWGE
jgi:hypothetical protein